MRRSILALLALAVVGGAGVAAAQSFPSKPVRIIVPVAAGGGTDILARMVADKLGRTWSQPVIVDNKPGAAHIVGTTFLTQSPPDGHTLLMMGLPHVVNPSLYKTMPYASGDFVPIALMAQIPIVVAVHPSAPYKNLSELVAAARSRSEPIHFASTSANGSGHLAGELLKLAAGIPLVHVPYKGSSAAMIDVVAGRVPLMFDALVTVEPHLRSGALRALAITTSQRSPKFPEIPTTAELGYPSVNVSGWLGMMAPKGTPDSVADAVNRAVTSVLADREVAAELQKQGWQVLPIGPSRPAFASFLVTEEKKWREVARAAGLKAD